MTSTSQRHALLMSGLLAVVLGEAVLADNPTSANYQIRWDTLDAGGGRSLSASYTLTDTVAPAAAGDGSSVNFELAVGFQTPPDSDADLVRDFMDNCTLDPNTDQLDTNGDGYGNRCDADLSNDGVINFVDLGELKAAMFSDPAAPNWNPDADITGDQQVDFVDLGQMKLFFFSAPGPSSIAP